MRNFFVKDLMISVFRDDLSEIASCGACTSDSSGPPCSTVCPGTKDPLPDLTDGIRLEVNPVVLAALQKELEIQLHAVREQQQAVMRQLQPTNDEERALVRQQLTEAHRSLDAGA
jgi:hypothetical protein